MRIAFTEIAETRVVECGLHADRIHAMRTGQQVEVLDQCCIEERCLVADLGGDETAKQRRAIVGLYAEHVDRSEIEMVVVDDAAQERRFTCAVGAGDACTLAGPDLEVEVVEQGLGTEGASSTRNGQHETNILHT